jgi:hypothetical protein
MLPHMDACTHISAHTHTHEITHMHTHRERKGDWVSYVWMLACLLSPQASLECVNDIV